jgi:hypothetical protein
MGEIDYSTAALRVFGDELIPDQITKLLGCVPTRSQTKGDVRVLKSGKTIVAKYGSWVFHVVDRKPEDLDCQIEEMFGKMADDLECWRGLSAKYDVNLFCGLFMGSSNDGLSLSPKLLLLLGQRGVELQFDIYQPSENDLPEATLSD